jgi:nucleolar pre-ribosomal-associated protein 2
MKFGDLEDLGMFVLDTHRRRFGNEESPEALLSQREDLKLLSRLATLSLAYDRPTPFYVQVLTGRRRQMASGTLGAREQSYLEDASALLRSPSEDSETILRLLLLRAYISVLQDSSAQKQLKDWDGIASDLRSATASLARRALKSGWRGRGLLALLTALEALDLLDAKRIKKALKEHIPLLVEANSQKLDSGVEAFRWEIRMFLAKHFPEHLRSPLDIVLPDSGHSSGDKSSFLRYVDAVVQDADDETRLAYLRDLLVDQDKSDGLASLRRYTVVCWLLRHIKGAFL